jgi:hypothetical protein
MTFLRFMGRLYALQRRDRSLVLSKVANGTVATRGSTIFRLNKDHQWEALSKAGRRRQPSPGQLGLFGGHNEGDTKVENGVTYRLNSNSRWERTDKPKTSKPSAPKVAPVIEDSDTGASTGNTLETKSPLIHIVNYGWHEPFKKELSELSVKTAFSSALSKILGFEVDIEAFSRSDARNFLAIIGGGFSDTSEFIDFSDGLRNLDRLGFLEYDRESDRFFPTEKGERLAEEFFRQEASILSRKRRSYEQSPSQGPQSSVEEHRSPRLKMRAELKEIAVQQDTKRFLEKMKAGPSVPSLDSLGKRVATSIREALDTEGLTESDIDIDLWQKIEYAKHDRGLSWPKAVGWAVARQAKETPPGGTKR